MSSLQLMKQLEIDAAVCLDGIVQCAVGSAFSLYSSNKRKDSKKHKENKKKTKKTTKENKRKESSSNEWNI